MGNCCGCYKEKNKKLKEGVLLSGIKDKIRPLDLIAFRGNDVASDLVYKCQTARQMAMRHNGLIFTHVGIIVTRDVLDHPKMEHGKLYILESTFSETGITDINGKLPFGVQIRELEKVIVDYDKPEDTLIAWCPLFDNPHNETNTKLILNTIYDEIQDKTWDANCWSLCSSLYPLFRPCRCCMEHVFYTENWLFCSEMVAIIYKSLGVLPRSINPKDVVPDDLVNAFNDSDFMPTITHIPTVITTPCHLP